MSLGRRPFKPNVGFELRCAVREAVLPSGPTKAVLMALALRWPCIEATGECLALDAGVSRESVVKATRRLIGMGLVTCESRAGQGGANRYTLDLQAIRALDRRFVLG